MRVTTRARAWLGRAQFRELAAVELLVVIHVELFKPAIQLLLVEFAPSFEYRLPFVVILLFLGGAPNCHAGRHGGCSKPAANGVRAITEGRAELFSAATQRKRGYES